MAKISYYLDGRKSGRPNVKMRISAGSKAAMLSMGVQLDNEKQWTGDTNTPIVGHPLAKVWNAMLLARMAAAMEALYALQMRGEEYTIADIKDAVCAKIDPNAVRENVPDNALVKIWRKHMEGKTGRTFELYHETLKRIESFVGGQAALIKLKIEDITLQWLDEFDRWMSSTRGVNSRSIDMRNLRAVCMYAWRYDLTDKYVFKRWKIKREEGDIHPLTSDQFTRIFTFDLSGRPDLQMYRDMALLGFYLIGINMVDLHALTWNDVENGYIKYRRAKTHRKYRVKIEPEAQAIIDKYKGENHLLSWADRYRDHRDFVKHLNDALQKIGPSRVEAIEGSYHGRTHVVYEPIVKDMTYYRMRHTFGCFAGEIDIPKDVIALCLGHGKKTVTDVYVQYDQRKIDDANRKVIDYALKLMNGTAG